MIRGLIGGTVAEELVYGEVSDGATSDLQRATSIARKMVAEFGMSPKLGRVSYQSEGRSPFLAGGGANLDAWSQKTAREIDLEVRRVLDEAYAATREILSRRRLALEDLATQLIEKETLDASELQAVLDRTPLSGRLQPRIRRGIRPRPVASAGRGRPAVSRRPSSRLNRPRRLGGPILRGHEFHDLRPAIRPPAIDPDRRHRDGRGSTARRRGRRLLGGHPAGDAVEAERGSRSRSGRSARAKSRVEDQVEPDPC